MAKDILTLGPVLSFRGIGDDKRWKVTALIGVPADTQAPTLRLDGKAGEAPQLLHTHGKESFYRYDLSTALQPEETRVRFGFEEGAAWSFTVPAQGQAPRMAYVSCNGYADPSAMRKLVGPANAVWQDLLANHDRELRPRSYPLDKEQRWHESRIQQQGLQRFHLLLMGGDQIYLDSIWEDLPDLKKWVTLSRQKQLEFEVDKDLETSIANYYFTLYSKRWLPDTRAPWSEQPADGDCADAMARIPTVMMWDDHDIFDGWGSYSCEMQHCPLFQTLFRHARQAFWLFQMQHALADLPPLLELSDDADAAIARKDPLFAPQNWQACLQHDVLALPLLDNQPGFSFAHQLGPVSLLVADLRSERSRTQIMGADSWRALQSWCAALAGSRADEELLCQHLLLMSSVPVIHPKLSLAESTLDLFGSDDVLDSNADDIRDHWSHDDHEGERKRLLETLSAVAEQHRLRVSILSGDVHVAAWGSVYRSDVAATSGWAQIQQFTSSAVVHPSLSGVLEKLYLHFLNTAATRVQTIDIHYKVEMMRFPGHKQYIMPARNWLALELDGSADSQNGCKLWASWRCETSSGFSNHLQAVKPARP